MSALSYQKNTGDWRHFTHYAGSKSQKQARSDGVIQEDGAVRLLASCLVVRAVKLRQLFHESLNSPTDY